MMELEFISNSPQQTIEFGKEIGQNLKGGEIFAIVGQLGTGKTHFIKGIAEGAGARDKDIVNSPTFVLVNEYHGRLDIYHIDAYRLDSPAEFEMIGFDDFCYPDSVVLIEWADKVMPVLEQVDRIDIQFSHIEENKRLLHFPNAPEYLFPEK